MCHWINPTVNPNEDCTGTSGWFRKNLIYSALLISFRTIRTHPANHYNRTVHNWLCRKERGNVFLWATSFCAWTAHWFNASSNRQGDREGGKHMRKKALVLFTVIFILLASVALAVTPYRYPTNGSNYTDYVYGCYKSAVGPQFRSRNATVFWWKRLLWFRRRESKNLFKSLGSQ